MLLSCSNTPPIVRTVTVTQTEYVFPPDNMLSNCLIPDYSAQTNAELAEYTLILIAKITGCDADWQRLTHWVESKR
ncbi:Rz1-like lysis system protein LysC [Shewanella surugensis]|uniref:Rz1-like lysis system protein LysC n=1 Tax=Shewanella surugensis TaxID=212020 RepID=UPI0035E13F92